MNNAHNPHDKRMYPGEAIELVLSTMNTHDKAEEPQEIARLAGVYCRETVQPWFVESHIKDLESRGWVLARLGFKFKVLTIGKGE